MTQSAEISNIMLKLQNYAKIPNGIITAEEIQMAFKNYGLISNMVNQPISEQARNEIFHMLIYKTDERKCTFNYEPINEGWNFFHTNLLDGRKPNYQWKVYIPIKSEHYGLIAKNVIAFLCDNGITSECKISGTLRSDSMIVSLENDEDVTSLNKYFEQYKSLKSCLGTHHPFIPDWNGIGVIHGHDVETSYTERLSGYLAHYINVCKRKNRLDLITAEAFLESMKNALNNGLVQRPYEIQQIIEHMDIIMNGRDYLQYDSVDFESHHK